MATLAAIRVAMAAGEQGVAFRTLVELQAANYGDPAILDDVATLMAELGQHGTAVEIRERICRLLPDNTIATLNLMVDRAAGMPEAHVRLGIETDLQRMLPKLGPEPAIWDRVSLLWERLGKLGNAVAACRRAMDAGADRLASRRRLVYLELWRNMPRNALAELAPLLDGPALPPSNLHEFGLLASKCGDTALALRFARRQHAISPDDLQGLDHLVSALVANGGGAEAMAVLTRGLAIHAGQMLSRDLYLTAAKLFMEAGAADEEAKIIDQARMHYPDDEQIREMSQGLEFVRRMGGGQPVRSAPHRTPLRKYLANIFRRNGRS